MLIWAMWAAVLAECALVLLFPSRPPQSWQVAGSFLSIFAVATATAALAVITRLLGTRHRLLALLVLCASMLLPVAAVSVASWGWAVAAGVACVVGLLVVETMPPPRRLPLGAERTRTMRLAGSAAALAVIPWILAFTAMARSWTLSGEPGQAFGQLLTGAMALSVFAYGIAAAGAVSNAVPRRQARALSWLRRVTTPVLVALVVTKTAYLTTRLTFAPDVFGDRVAWDVIGRSTASWAHAVRLVGFIVVLLHRSSRVPLKTSGLNVAIPAVAAVVGLGPVLDLADATSLWGWLMVEPIAASQAASQLLGQGPFSHVTQDLRLVGSLALGAAGLARWGMRGWDAGTALLLLGCLYMAPLMWNSLQEHPPGMALPTQVDIVATVSVGVVLCGRAVNSMRGRPASGPFAHANQDLARLVVTTFVAVHAVVLLPEDWEDRLVQELAVLSLLLIALGLPPTAADPVRRVRTLLSIVAVELATMTALLLTLVTGMPDLVTDFLGEYTNIAVLLIAVPLAGLYAVRLRRADQSLEDEAIVGAVQR